MDLLGMAALRKMFRGAGKPVPKDNVLFSAAMAGDLVGNAFYYSSSGLSGDRHVIARSTVLGVMAGIGALALPRPLGLDDAPSRRTTATALMTVGLYTLGGLAAGAAMRLLQRRQRVSVPAEGLAL
jgi:hypothetical protein